MRVVFADTSFWIATTDPKDSWHDRAVAIRGQLSGTLIVTTDEVLVEYLNTFSGAGEYLRRMAAATIKSILASSAVRTLPQTHESFLEGLKRYEARSDKEYSITDCISMVVMEREKITEVLSNDHHFEQAGFVRLLK